MHKSDPTYASFNEGRQRRGRTSLEELDRTLRALEERLEAARRVPEPAAPRSARENAGAAHPGTKTDASELILQQERNRAAIEALAAEIRTLRADLLGIAEKAETGSMRAELARLREELRALELRRSEPGTEALRPEIDEIRRALAALLRDHAAAGARAEREEKGPHLARLVDRIEAISHAIDALPDQLRTHSMEEQLRQLARSMEQFARSRSQEAPGSLDLIERRLDEIARAIVSSTVTMHSAIPDPDVFDRIEARMGALSRQIEALAGSGEGAELLGRLSALAGKIEQLASATSSQAIADLGAQVSALASRIDGAPAGLADSRMRELEDRLDAILAHLVRNGSGTNSDALLDAVDERFSKLARYLESQPPVDSEVLRRLSGQIGELTAMLGQVSLDPADPRLARIEQAISDSRAQMVQVAREAAERALNSLGAREDKGASASALAAELRRVSELARQSDERNARTFEAIHDTLLKICARLAAIGTDAEDAVAGDWPSQGDDEAELFAGAPGKALPDDSSDERAIRFVDDPLPATSSADFIAAARRAAQAAAAREASSGSSSGGAAGTGLGALLRNRKGWLSAASVMLIGLIGLQIGLTLRGNPVEVATREAVTRVAREARAPAPGAEAQLTALPSAGAAGSGLNEPAVDRRETVSAISAVPVPARIALDDIPRQVGPLALRQAAAAGDPRAIFEIGARYGDGRGVPANPEAAATWIERAAEMGYAPAQYRIGNLYEKGQGVGRDPEKALAWYRRAAEQGHVSAMHNLAVLLAVGAGGAPDPAAAARWFLEAAERAVTDSQYNLGVMATRGAGMERDLVQAYKWFALAAHAGDRLAAAKRDEIAALLDEEQLAKAMADVELWKARPADPAVNAVEIPRGWSEEAGDAGAVADVQRSLARQGYDVGPPDGVFGDRTRDAIRRFQADHGLAETGEIDATLLERLLAGK